MPVTIRDFKQTERDLYIALGSEFYATDAVSHPIPREYFGRTFDEFIGGNEMARCLAFELDGRIVGFALLALTWSNEAGGLCVWLEEAYILPDFQRQGLAHAFFDFVNREYAGRVKRFRLEVERSNADAVRLYEKMGFRELEYLPMFRDL